MNPELEMWFHLALKIGTTVENLQGLMSRTEFIYWLAYIKKNGPIGWQRDDLNHALTRFEIRSSSLCLSDMSRSERKKAFAMENFLLNFERPKQKKRKKISKKQREQMEKQVEQMFAAAATRVVVLGEHGKKARIENGGN